MKVKVLQNALLEHSAILLPCIKRYSALKANFRSFLSGRLRQVLLYYNVMHVCPIYSRVNLALWMLVDITNTSKIVLTTGFSLFICKW